MNIKIKRIYDDAQTDDGYRVLVDRLWPRGVTKERAHIDEWNKEVCPSDSLRKWFDHRPELFEEFKLLYWLELAEKGDELNRLRHLSEEKPLTLIYAAKNENINHALVLKNVLEE